MGRRISAAHVATAAAVLMLIGGAARLSSAHATGKGQSVEVTPQSSSGSSGVTITVIVRTDPYSGCEASVTHLRTTKQLRALRTSREHGTGRWQWDVARGVRRGRWTIEVTCSTAAGTVEDTATIETAAGPPGRAIRGRLFAPGSMHVDGHGSGSGGADNPYPRGECTWWAWLKRPDLPYFPGVGGDALNWARSAAQRHIPVGRRPVTGAIAVIPPHRYGAGYLGHVAYVERVAGDTIRISEAAFADRPPGHRRTLPVRGLRFIYGGPAGDGRGGAPQKPFTAHVDPQPGVFIHHVRRTCYNGHCGLPKLSGPSSKAFRTLAVVPDGTELGVTCQTTGERVTGIDGSSSSVWDALTDGSYVADYYVDTPGTDGAFSPPIPRCIAGAATPESDPPPYQAFHVRGTCAQRGCVLTVRDGTAFEGTDAVETLDEGAEVHVTCQLPGERVSDQQAVETIVWDRLVDGHFVSDRYVDTPGGPEGYTASIPHCEQQGHRGVNTFTNPYDALGMGTAIAPGQVVEIACRVYAPQIVSANPDGYWYRIAPEPWGGSYYSPANTFMNGDPWDGPYSRNTDFAVPSC